MVVGGRRATNGTNMRRRSTTRGWGLALAVGLAVAVAPVLACGRTSDGGTRPRIDAGTPKAPDPAPLAAAPKVMIIGLDGADLDEVERLAGEGRLPNLTRLMNEGVTGRIATVANASPIIWTSVATGVMPEKHGIEFFRKDGEPAASTMRKRPAFWNVLTHYGRSVGVLSWWATFPAEEVAGYMISPYVVLMPPRGTQARVGRLWDPGDPRKMFPRRLQTELADLVYTADDLDLDAMGHLHADEVRTTNTPWVLAKDMSYYEMALRLLRSDPVELVAVYYQGIDAGSHDFERHVYGRNVNEVRDPKVGPDEFEAARARVDAMYVYNDRMVGGLTAGLAGDTDVIVVSDHGWSYDGTGHWNEDPGIFVAAGPSFLARGTIEGLSVLDVAPIVLAILGAPLSRDLDGKIPEGLLRDEIVAGVEWVDEYPMPAVALPDDVDSSAPEDELMVERLRSLGYVGEDED